MNKAARRRMPMKLSGNERTQMSHPARAGGVRIETGASRRITDWRKQTTTNRKIKI